jgi:hypothetical protein
MKNKEITVFVHSCSDPQSMVFDRKERKTLTVEIERETEKGMDVIINGSIYFVFRKRPFIRQIKDNISWFNGQILTLN